MLLQFTTTCPFSVLFGAVAALCVIWLHSLYAHGWNGIQCCVSCCEEVVLILAHLDGVQPVADRDEKRVVRHVLWGVGEAEMTNRKSRNAKRQVSISLRIIMPVVLNDKLCECDITTNHFPMHTLSCLKKCFSLLYEVWHKNINLQTLAWVINHSQYYSFIVFSLKKLHYYCLVMWYQAGMV